MHVFVFSLLCWTIVHDLVVGILVLSNFDLISKVMFPDHLKDANQQIHAPLKSLDSAQLRNGRGGVEMLDPAP